MPLARRQRADAKQVQDVAWAIGHGSVLRLGAAARLPPIDTGLDDAQLRDRHAVGCQRARRPLARRDHALRVGQGATLECRITLRRLGIESRLERDRVMHERHERESSRFVGEHTVEPRQREPVDDDDASGRNGGERGARRAQRRRRGRREARVERVHSDAEAAVGEAGHDLAVVDVAARRRLDIAGNDEVDGCHAAAFNARACLHTQPTRHAIRAA